MRCQYGACDAVVGGRGDDVDPIAGALVGGHGPEARPAGVVDREEVPAILGDTAMGDGLSVDTIPAHPTAGDGRPGPFGRAAERDLE